MNKSARKFLCLALSAITAISFVGCDDDQPSSGSNSEQNKTYKYDPETRPVVFATEALDGNFNPFFSTSATDSKMVGMTQLGMLTTDENGKPLCGKNEDTVALAYDVSQVQEGENTYTDYQFIIKNGLKFSDGTALTIKDVLFNLYVYLDPAYMGSATMYSTDIVGLKAYRRQDPAATGDESAWNATFTAAANERRLNLAYYLDGDPDTAPTDVEKAKKDTVTLKEMFKEEVTSDWNMHKGTLESYEDEYAFTEDWQVYYFAEGVVKIQYDGAGKPYRDENGKYVTNLTPDGIILDNGNEYNSGNNYNPNYAKEIDEVKNDEALIKAYTDKGATREDAQEFVVRDFAINTVYSSKADYDDQMVEVLYYWATGTNIFDKFTAEARTEALKELQGADGKLVVDSISGITTATTTKDFKGNDLGASHDVLKIRINGVDPKAIYNFAFAVAPLHYYSGTYEGVDYSKAEGNFGVAFNDSTFFEEVLQDDDKNKKPVGAGPYQASNDKGQIDSATVTVDGDDFYSNNWVYFARNDYFTTVGPEIENAKIKYLHYRVVNSDQLIQSLEAKNIDVGEPNATSKNVELISKIAHVKQRTYVTNGYGYVGVNPKYVPDLEVRQAIMKAMDPVHCLTYYTEEYAEILYRSMSTQSWIWKNVEMPTTRPEELAIATSNAEIERLVESAGWKKNASGIYAKDGKTLKFTFTIAGATDDHPATEMFHKAAETLNKCGFDITVTTDITALKKLATGQLQVWAAAWSSTADPDMYQVYHKDSKATSVNNWGYPTILNDSTGAFYREQQTIDALSTLIEEGRATNNEQDRSEIYLQALDKVLELAVELPTYQRRDMVAYNSEVIDFNSLNQNPTAFQGVIHKIWELDYN